MQANQYLTPEVILYGMNALDNLTGEGSRIGTKALLVTDEIMEEQGYVERVGETLNKAGMEYVVYNGVSGEPTDEMVNKGLSIYKENNCDSIVSLGGGSPIDAGKAIGILASNSGKISDYMGFNKFAKELPPMVAIPTTAGTGSEATKVTIITDTTNDVKMLIGSPYLVSNIAVVDPGFTLSVPARITAATGVDALTHAIEAYTSVKNQPLTDNLALSAIGRISKYLRRAFANGDDLEARSEIMLAALEAGLAFSNSSVTIVHGMSRPIGAVFHVAHGISNAVLLPACMEFAVMGAPERFARVAIEMGVKDNDMDDLELARKGVEKVQELCRDVQIPSITELGIDREEFMGYAEKMAEDAIASGSPANTARKASKEEIIELYRKSL